MRLLLQDLQANHPMLQGHSVDFSKSGALAFQRAGHEPPIVMNIDHNGSATSAEVDWAPQSLTDLDVLDAHRITEDGAEAVAISYVHAKAGWVVKRRLQRGESADWLLKNETAWLALEVSGTASGNPNARLTEKKQQIARCTLPAELLAVVVAFDISLILAASL